MNTQLITKKQRQENSQTSRQVAPKVLKTAPQYRSVWSAKKNKTPQLVTPNGTKPVDSPKYSRQTPATYFEQVFQINKVIGCGSYGEVFATQSREDSHSYAVKVSLTPLRPNAVNRHKEAANHMMIPPHKNLIRFFQAWEECDRLYIQTELCVQSLQHYCSMKHLIPEAEIWNFFVDMVQAVHHLHTNDIIHDDIKPDNVFLTKNMVCKLGDFGLTVNLRNPADIKTAEDGDSRYLAPEVLNSRPTKASDMFSLGMTIFEAATDIELPSGGEHWHALRRGEIPEKFFERMSAELRKTVESMLKGNPMHRPDAKQLMNSQLMKEKIRGRDEFIRKIEMLPAQPQTPIHPADFTGSSPAYERSLTASALRQAARHLPLNDDDEGPSIQKLNLDFDDDDSDEEVIVRPKFSSSGVGSMDSCRKAMEDKKTRMSKFARRLDFLPKKAEVPSPVVITAEERTARYQRMRASEEILDENDWADQVDERPPPKACLTRLRSVFQNRPVVSRLDFSKLDG